jgi:hypothetical protein
MTHDGEIERPGEREATEIAEKRMATTLENIRILIVGGVVLLALLGTPVILAALAEGGM